MKTVYIAHPLRGGTQNPHAIHENYLKADALMLVLAREHEDEEILFLSPIHVFSFVSPLGPQDWVMKQCTALLELADELWVFGDWKSSEGCRAEVEHANKLGMKIVFEDGRITGECSRSCEGTQCPSLTA